MSGFVHGFGVDDPDEKVLSPIVWIPLTLLALVCCLFIAFKRAEALQTYDNAKQYVLDRLPWSTSSSNRRRKGGIALSYADLEAPADSDDEGSDDDELPRTSGIDMNDDDETNGLANKVGTHMNKAFRVLGIAGPSRGSYMSPNNGNYTATSTTPGIAQAFWGIRPQDRTGQIRLGSSNANSGNKSKRTGPTSSLGGLNGLFERVTDLSGSRQSRPAPESPELFDVGNDDVDDAVELSGHDVSHGPARP